MTKINLLLPEADPDLIREAVRENLGCGRVAKIKRGSVKRRQVNFSGPLASAIFAEAQRLEASPLEVVIGCLGGGVEVAQKESVDIVYPVEVERKPPPQPAVKRAPTDLEVRCAIVARDAALGKWHTWVIIGGSAAVNPMPLDRDFGDEIADGLVFEDTIPWRYDQEEAEAWRWARIREGKAVDWVFVTGDCETLAEAEDSRRRGALRDSGQPLDALMETEARERLEVAVEGRKRGYAELARATEAKVLEYQRREGILGLGREEARRVLLGAASATSPPPCQSLPM